VETLLRRYPSLGPAKVFDALAFALDNPEVIEADIAREQELLSQAGKQSGARRARSEQIELPFVDGSAAVKDPE
jgi:hypothetical protein